MPSLGSAVFMALGGLALFLLGMNVMTEGLRQAAGPRIRQILLVATRNRSNGYALGTSLGFLMHSSAASVMTVGFVNAGLLSLAASLPVLYGLNLGTTLSMQLIAFQLTNLAYALLFFGFAARMLAPGQAARECGRSIMGFGLIFLGMDLMSQAIEPYQSDLGPALAAFNAASPIGFAVVLLAAVGVTALLQSSGAVIGMAFVMLNSGVLDSLQQAYPIVLGAHLGTTVTALLASIGAGIEARRAAIGNLAFNLANVLLGIALAGPLLWLLELSAESLARQAANAHTAVMLLAGLLLLPLAGRHAWLMRKALPSKKPLPETSFLDPALLSKPESALGAVMRELSRALGICQESLQAVTRLQRSADRRLLRLLARNEEAINEIKESAEEYLVTLTKRYLSRRQALMVQYLSRANANVERIGDHLTSIVEIVLRRDANPAGALKETDIETLEALFDRIRQTFEKLREGLRPERNDFDAAAEEIIQTRDAFAKEAGAAQDRFNRRVANHEEEALAGLLHTETIIALNRMARHAKLIAYEMKQPFFATKPRKLGRVEPELPLP